MMKIIACAMLKHILRPSWCAPQSHANLGMHYTRAKFSRPFNCSCNLELHRISKKNIKNQKFDESS